MVEYAKSIDIVDDPSFMWWAPYILRKRNYVISKVNIQVKKINHKYGLEVLKDYADTVWIDNDNKNTY